MYNKEEAFNILTNTIRYNKEHRDYDWVVKLAKKYKAMISGEGLEEYLQQFNLREDETMFDQRKRLTQYVVSCITGSLITPEKKISGIKPIKDEYGYGSENDASTKKQDLDNRIKEFYGQHGINEYLTDHFMNLYDSDPNAFILYLIKPFDPKKQKPEVYATSISSEDAMDFEYQNNVLQYLTVRKKIKYELTQSEQSGEYRKPTYQDGFYYTIYADNDQVEFSQIDLKRFQSNFSENTLVDENFNAVEISQTTINKKYYYKVDKTSLYEVVFYMPKSKRVPAFRVGNIPDISTDRRTRVNAWHRALPYLMKSIKTCSELDLTFTFHAFPQKFEYAPRCQGAVIDKQRIPCSGGLTSSGDQCTECKGSGFQVSSSSQEVVRMALPKDPNDIFDLQKLAYYLQLPIETVKTMIEYANMIEAKAIKAVYNNDIINQEQVQVATATKVLTERQSVYDALSPVAKRYSYGKKFTILQIANYNDLEKGLIIEHIFPSDMGFETVAELIAKISAAKQAGVSDYVLQQMNNDLTKLVYVDQPQVLKEIKVKASFNPFEGKEESVIISILSNKDCTKFDRVLWSNFKSIFTQAENEAKQNGSVDFYDLTYTEQKKRIDKIVDDLIAQIDSEKQVTVDATSSFFDMPPAKPNGQTKTEPVV